MIVLTTGWFLLCDVAFFVFSLILLHRAVCTTAIAYRIGGLENVM